MKWLYFALNVGSVSIPFLYSFHKGMNFIKDWKPFLLSTTAVAAVFLVWDTVFTAQGVWGFNSDYYLGITILKMPIEEWMFFFCIPYASIFIHYSLKYFLPRVLLPVGLTKVLAGVLFTGSVFLVFNHFPKKYTTVNYSFLALTLLSGSYFYFEQLRRFFIAFLIILIPFFAVNGILTGTGLESPVVWYNNAENLNIRMGTIPVEDAGYAFSLLFLNIMLFEKLKKRF